MNLFDYWNILRRRWLLVLGLPLLVALISLAVGLTRTPRYESSARVIATRGVADENSTAGMTWAREDTVAQDLPTIISSAAFARDVAAELQRQGSALDEAAVAGSLHGANDGKIVTITAAATRPEDAQAIAQAAINMLQANGLRYWGDPTWSPEEPGVNIGPLDPAGAARAVPTRRQIFEDALLRAAVGLIVGVGLAVGLAYGEERRADTARQSPRPRSTVS